MCLHYWKISKYTLGDDKIWFTRSLDVLANDMSISKSSVIRYLNTLEDQGLIVRINKLGWDKQSQSVKKRLYIRITDKLLLLTGSDQSKSTSEIPTTIAQTIPSHANDALTASIPVVNLSTINQENLLPTDFGILENVKMEFPIYKGNYSKTKNNSTVRQPSIVNNLKTTSIHPTKPSYDIERSIGEQLDKRLKNYIKGMLANLQTQNDVQISNPEQVFAEVVFSVLNKENQMIGIEDSHHRVNIIAKLLRKRQWTTPKGFYNHSEFGQLFRKKQKINETIHQQQKHAGSGLETNNEGYEGSKQEQDLPFSSQKQTGNPYSPNLELKQVQGQLQAVDLEINSEKHYLRQMEVSYKKTKSNLTQTIIDGIALKLDKLYEQQALLNQKLEQSMAA